MNNQEYFQTGNIQLEEYSENSITQKYNQGYVLTRTSKGNMIQTRSLRIDLSKFELNSENRRILNKNNNLGFRLRTLPLEDYSWEIHALGKDFYSKRFGDGTMSASKIKEMFQDKEKSNMNAVFDYKFITNENSKPNIAVETIIGTNYSKIIENLTKPQANTPVGYCLCYVNNEIVHYAYPFYDLEIPKEQNLGIAMMTKAIVWAKDNGKKYIYLGSVVESSSKYKLQFEGLEWFNTDKKEWSNDIQKLKSLLESNH